MNQKSHNGDSENYISDALRMACERSFGVLDSNFLCQSLSVLNPPQPICVPETATIEEVVNKFNDKNIGSVLIVDVKDKLRGIFTERDMVRRVLPGYPGNKKHLITEFMTHDPNCQAPDITVAFALNLMSHGGFRHIPLVDAQLRPIGIVSVRDVVDYIASTVMDDLLKFESDE